MESYKLVELIADCSVLPISQYSSAHPIGSGYRPNFFIDGKYFPCQVAAENDVAPGATGRITIRVILEEEVAIRIKAGDEFELREAPHTIAFCVIEEVSSTEEL